MVREANQPVRNSCALDGNEADDDLRAPREVVGNAGAGAESVERCRAPGPRSCRSVGTRWQSNVTAAGASAEERQLAEKLVAQEERYLNQADVVSARLLFRRAVENLALAAIRLAATFDPAELSRVKVEGVAADQTEARKWYERLGSLEPQRPRSTWQDLAADETCWVRFDAMVIDATRARPFRSR
jgi:hypothetical protein